MQVTKLATYGYFTFACISRQDLINDSPLVKEHSLDLYFPVLTTLEFFFYVGWLKVGEYLL
jgi:hypothetical protein